MRKLVPVLLPTVSLCAGGLAAPRQEVQQFLENYNSVYRQLYTVAQEAAWRASTDVKPEHTGQRIGAEQALAAFVGSPHVIQKARAFLKQRRGLDDLATRQLEVILLKAAEFPGTVPEVVAARVAAEARQAAALDGFEFRLPRPDGGTQVVTPNELDDLLVSCRDLTERLRVWETSKQTGPALKRGLLELRDLRNRVAREMGYRSYFHLQVAAYGMTVREMMDLNDRLLADVRPLYEQLHCWARHELARRYGQPVPQLIPAHWLPNRWGQAWPGLVAAVDLDAPLRSRPPEWLLQQAERFYVSLGFPQLPATFWTRSDLYELPADSPRKKNTHASAWHVDLERDVRALMSVKPDFDWFTTTHHELGHIYYDLAYARPEVPVVLRAGANRAFHEAVGELITTAVRQPPYLRQVGVLAPTARPDRLQWLLNEALSEAVVFIPWSAGVMTHWEHDFYEQDLPADQLNARWWQYVARFQGIAPPSPRSEAFCDPATKTHIHDDPAAYYDYALAFALKYQLHLHLAKTVLRQDPHEANYHGRKEVGRFLQDILKLGATRDWRQVVREHLHDDLNGRALVAYFAPLADWLQARNQGRSVGWQ